MHKSSLLFGALALAAAPALAQDDAPARSGFVEPGQEAPPAWKHEPSGLALPPAIAGFARGKITRFDEEGRNVAIAFRGTDDTFATLYVYRAGVPSVAIWSDRAASVMLSNSKLGEVDPDTLIIAPFSPPAGAGADSGVRISAGFRGEGAGATGLSLHVHDGWLVKLRMTSRSLSAAGLDARIAALVGALDLPRASETAPLYAAIEECENRLDAEKPAKLVALDTTANILIGGIIGSLRDERAGAWSDPDARWCRDAASRREYGIYRSSSSRNSYLLAYGDSGTSLFAARYNMVSLIKPSRLFLAVQSDGTREVVYPPFDRLPTPAQMAGLPGNLAPVMSFDLRPGADGAATIHVNAE